ncbi:MAG: FtsX-like permease family protein [Bacteroidales bacterium]|nr:FtsX-like permease family protein [Bacteroidales bacterium]
MNLPLFIANRISGKDKENLSGPVIRIAVITIALGLSVMILAVAVLVGFQTEIRNKVIGFSAHIQIDNFDENASYEASPVSMDQPFYPELDKVDGIKHIQVFTLKAGIIKTDDQLQGIVLKGIGPDYDWGFLKEHLTSGSIFQVNDTMASGELLISGIISQKLKLKIGDEVRMYFLSGSESQPRGRKFNISGIYETGLEEFDDVYVIGDLRHIQRLNNWNTDMVSGFEVFIDDFKSLDKMGEMVYQMIGYDLNAETVTEAYPQIFDWLRLMDINVIIILVLMILVAGITIISTLLIMILERTNMIGVLKALGINDNDLRKLFVYLTARIIARGLLWGNITGIGIALIQHWTKILPLDEESYYISFVPVSLNISHILLINAGTFLVCLLMVLIPGFIIGRITPVKAIGFR